MARPPATMRSSATAVRVMICDDSTVIRGALARILNSDPEVSVVAKAENGKLAVEQIGAARVDVVVLDIEMPVMDGLTALPLLLRADPGIRIIMASTLTTRGADIALRALRMGAADYVPKPSSIGTVSDAGFKRELLEKVKGLGRVRRRAMMPNPSRAPIALRAAPPFPARLLAIGSSTGGPQALFTLVQGLGRSVSVPVVMTQHMPATFTPILADHLNRLGMMPCTEARDGEALVAGRIYLAPGDRHLLVEGGRAGLRARLTTDPPENFCRPSVDPMLRTATAACDGRVLVAMLTGMGHDGLAGTAKVIEAGGAAIGQDEATSVVWGMPGAVAQAGLCHAVLPLPKIAPKLLDMLKGARP
ncbi:MAG: two-component system, chemotaxis family, protein-glutamate methylesterase/glutaminase [Acetobacteraceae bacterium]|jgi:two-component system chemotaxis response regulator CheB|nr:two-component system, chemotaxis family, protein-glutamate methylesterase/glutaminase [Acetobacteraceae bacterium]